MLRFPDRPTFRKGGKFHSAASSFASCEFENRQNGIALGILIVIDAILLKQEPGFEIANSLSADASKNNGIPRLTLGMMLDVGASFAMTPTLRA
jgi:hypothetical protein